MLNIYYARESTDKEKFIFENITPGSFVIVPDQYTLEAERRAFRHMKVKGLPDIEILGFSRLGDKVLNATGRDGRVLIDKYGRQMLLTGIILKRRTLRYTRALKKRTPLLKWSTTSYPKSNSTV